MIPSVVTIKLEVTVKDGSVRFEVHAKPRAKKSRILGMRGEALEVALAAPPVDGAANAELRRILSEALDVPKRSVEIVRGETSQKKLVAVAGIAEKVLLERLSAFSFREKDTLT
jgi:uncharacterized protein (TIGR00251 family)